MSYSIISLIDMPEMKECAAKWFHDKWKIPLDAYMDSMAECLTQKQRVPQWYLAMEDNRIIGGLGVIENDFHDRKDLSPNVCAVYTEKDKRCRGIAGALLDYVCEDMSKRGVDTSLLQRLCKPPNGCIIILSLEVLLCQEEKERQRK